MITKKNSLSKKLLLSLAISLVLTGCASTNPNDMWEGWNRGTQDFNDDVDKMVLKPVAKGYDAITPEPIDEGVTNFFSNLNDVGVMINDVLQFKMLQAGMDLSRFIINSSIGLGGMIDVASMVDLPKHNEDFGQTLGYWGVPSGPYLVLPFVGPSSPRDLVGMIGDAAMNPLTYVSIFGGAVGSAASGGASAVDVTDTRAGLMSTEKVVEEGSVDRYDFIKSSYQQHREYEIHDGNPPNVDPDAEGEAPAPAEGTFSGSLLKPALSSPQLQHGPQHKLKLTAPENKK